MDLNTFLEKYKIFDNSECSHTSYTGGKWYIPDDQLNKFYELYSKEYPITAQYFIERHISECSPIIIDIDIQQKTSGRQFTKELIDDIVDNIKGEIEEWFVEDSNYECYVLLRDEPYNVLKKNKNFYKDGLHIYFPYIVTDYDFQLMLRNKMLQTIKETLDDYKIKYENNIQDVYDISVIKRNGITMYGSTKMNVKPYGIKYVYYGNKKKISRIEKLKMFSIRNKYNLTEYKKNMEKQKNKYIDTYFIKSTEPLKTTISICTHQCNDDSFEIPNESQIKNKINIDEMEVLELIKLLPIEYASDYKLWYKIGACIYNTNDGYINVFKEFSKQCQEKYDEKYIDKLWCKYSNNIKNYRPTIIDLKLKMIDSGIIKLE